MNVVRETVYSINDWMAHNKGKCPHFQSLVPGLKVAYIFWIFIRQSCLRIACVLKIKQNLDISLYPQPNNVINCEI